MSVAFWVGGKMRRGGGNDDLTTEAKSRRAFRST